MYQSFQVRIFNSDIIQYEKVTNNIAKEAKAQWVGVGLKVNCKLDLNQIACSDKQKFNYILAVQHQDMKDIYRIIPRLVECSAPGCISGCQWPFQGKATCNTSFHVRIFLEP